MLTVVKRYADYVKKILVRRRARRITTIMRCKLTLISATAAKASPVACSVVAVRAICATTTTSGKITCMSNVYTKKNEQAATTRSKVCIRASRSISLLRLSEYSRSSIKSCVFFISRTTPIISE